MKKIILILLGAISLQTICAQPEKTIDWNADLDYLAKELPAKHCNLFAKCSEQEFQSGIEAIKAASGYLSDFETALRTQQLIAKCGDSHTMANFIQFLDGSKIVPLGLLWTSDGLHVIYTTQENNELLGHRIEAINKIPTATIVDSLSTLLTVDNGAMVKAKVPNLIPSLQILEYFGFSDGQQVELTLDGGKKYTLKTTIINQTNGISFKPDSLAFCIKNQNRFFSEHYFPEDKIYYMLYNSCSGRELEELRGNKERAATLPSFAEFEQKVFETLENNLVNKIIFDVRFNGGGNSSQGTAFAEKLAEYLKKHPGITVYVVLGRNTFSSAILNAMDFKRLTNALFVGEETAGKPNHFGEVQGFQLPNSKLYISYSTKYFQRSDKDVNTIMPDVSIETSFDDFTKGIDPVFEWIKAQPAAKQQKQGVN